MSFIQCALDLKKQVNLLFFKTTQFCDRRLLETLAGLQLAFEFAALIRDSHGERFAADVR